MKNRTFMRFIAAIFSGIATFVYVSYFPYEEMNPVAIFLVQLIIFLPIIMGVFDRDKFLKLSIASLIGSVIGMILSCIANNVGIWPISSVLWAAFSLPAIALLNIVGQRIKDSF